MIDEQLIDNWASAILSLAQAHKKISLFLAQSTQLIKLLKDYPDYISLLSSNKISKDERKEMIDTAFKDQLDVLLVNTLKSLVDDDHFIGVRLIFKKLRKLVNELNHIQYGNVYSVYPLTEDQLERIRDQISKKLNQEVELVNKIDPTLIGGIKVKVKNTIFDGSLKGKLNLLLETALNENRGE